MPNPTYYTIKDGEGHWWVSTDPDVGFELYGRPTNGSASLEIVEDVFGISADDSVKVEARRLMEAWRHARVILNGSASDRRIWAEQGAYDALVDFVEAHDLNETEFDPR